MVALQLCKFISFHDNEWILPMSTWTSAPSTYFVFRHYNNVVTGAASLRSFFVCVVGHESVNVGKLIFCNRKMDTVCLDRPSATTNIFGWMGECRQESLESRTIMFDGSE